MNIDDWILIVLVSIAAICAIYFMPENLHEDKMLIQSKKAPLYFKMGKLLTHPEKGCFEECDGKRYYTNLNGERNCIGYVNRQAELGSPNK